ncbi:glycosyltransferase family 4 protein [Aerosakkonemataceae cyanobacterium BLCC-F154]|uniref:Glycosyltransferase family 4 protein n=1 Tax=Floridaenema fluviatile BLCC-F154 TaxID=3153640 RepID=A0ABV4Y9I6_9CYAN
MQPLRILILTNLYPPQAIGGYERAIADYAKILHQRGHQVLVLTSDTQKHKVNYIRDNLEPPVKSCFNLTGTWSNGKALWFSPEEVVPINSQNKTILNAEIQNFQPQVCLAGNIDFLGLELLQIILSSGIPIAHYVMNANPGYFPEETPQTPDYKYITCSNWLKEHLQTQGYPTESTQTIYPGAAVTEFYQPELPPRDRLRIAYASLVMPYKGADILIAALSLLETLGIEFTATIAGGNFQPEFVEALQEMVELEGLTEKIKFPGVLSREELKQLYRTHNVLVFPSRFAEPFGISQIEAMAAGLTLVTSATGGAKEIVEHQVDGLVFESENPLDLADILSTLPQFPEEWQAITRQGQQRALSEFNQTKTVEQLESVFQELITNN